MTSFPTYQLGEEGHDTFPVRIECEKVKIWPFRLIGRETMVMSKCALIGRRISTRLWSEACCLKTKWRTRVACVFIIE